MRTDARLRERLREVSDPELGGDVVSLGLVGDVHVEDGRAFVSLAFSAPFSPSEWRMCDEVRALPRGVGLEPFVSADAGGRRAPVPRDRCPLPSADWPTTGRPIEPPGDSEFPYRDSALALTDRVGAIARRRVARPADGESV